MHSKHCRNNKLQSDSKSQASLEFLSTYAWAFIVISITLGTLYYYGIFDFGKYIPQKCIFTSQFKCLDFSLKPSEVRIKLVNNIGEDICVTSISITNDAVQPISCTLSSLPRINCAPGEFDWAHSTDKDIIFTPCSGGAYIVGERVELRVLMNYYAIDTKSKPIHAINGKINGRVSSG